MTNRPKNFDKVRAKIIARAWKDPQFKAELLKNPKAAFKKMGLDLPENFQVRVVEDKASSFTFVLPAAIRDVGELKERDLEKLAAAGNCCFSLKNTWNPTTIDEAR